jgi:hypothetical protein
VLSRSCLPAVIQGSIIELAVTGTLLELEGGPEPFMVDKRELFLREYISSSVIKSK